MTDADRQLSPHGGTELMLAGFINRIDPQLLDRVQIHPSRLLAVEQGKKQLLWMHNSLKDTRELHLEDGGWQKFDKLVFVSYWQRQQFVTRFGIPYDRTAVMKNAIVPIEAHTKPQQDPINLIYFATPHRGLELLYPAFNAVKKTRDNIRLHVYSSFDIYAQPELNATYQSLFDRLAADADIDYHGSVANDVIRHALTKAHILAYPCTYPETSCLCLIEAMSAGCLCVHPDYAALPETAANWTWMYGYQDDPSAHAQAFAMALDMAIANIRSTNVQAILQQQKSYTDRFYNWHDRGQQWTALLAQLAFS